MKQRSRKKMVQAVIIGAGLFAAVSILAGDVAFAYRNRPRTNPRGKIVVKLPKGHTTVWRGRNRYYFHGGAFYKKKKGPSGYVVVRAPIGAVVLSIPVGYRIVVVSGLTYYVYAGIYYRRVHNGYVVVEPPAKTVVVKEVSPVRPSVKKGGESVTVSAILLNVRSGPGMDFPVIQQVRVSDRLTVYGYAPDWLNVELPTGKFGWVMLRYTSPEEPPAKRKPNK
jgi:hypothetical protein